LRPSLVPSKGKSLHITSRPWQYRDTTYQKADKADAEAIRAARKKAREEAAAAKKAQ
jgi:hypothetical protein